MTTTPTILVIDDNVNLARGFAAGLMSAGYTVHVAHTAEDGLELAHGVQPHGIILGPSDAVCERRRVLIPPARGARPARHARIW